MKPKTMRAIAMLATTALLPAAALAQDTRNQGYLVDSYGNNVTTSSTTGLCWRDSDWTPARAVAACDGQIVPVAAAVPASAPKVAAAPTPPPAAPIAPAPAVVMRPVPREVAFSGDALFAFDTAVLRPEGVAMLDDFVRRIEGATYESIHVTGHADRIGSSAYNQKLSERRSATVKEYLVGKDIAATRITAAGVGETQPVTEAGRCMGAATAAVIACLQPDRRVVVDMKGTTTVTGSR